MEQMALLLAGAGGAVAASVWTWWLLRELRVADERRVAPLQDAAATSAAAAKALTDIVVGLGAELAEAHRTNAQILAALTPRAGTRVSSVAPVTEEAMAEAAVMGERAEAARSRAIRQARAVSGNDLVDPSGEGLDDE